MTLEEILNKIDSHFDESSPEQIWSELGVTEKLHGDSLKEYCSGLSGFNNSDVLSFYSNDLSERNTQQNNFIALKSIVFSDKNMTYDICLTKNNYSMSDHKHEATYDDNIPFAA